MAYIPQKSKFLYKEIQEYLYNLMHDNFSDINYKFPPESELQEKFKVSRITVKNAFSNLERQGLIYRAAGRGTFICKNLSIDDINFKATRPTKSEDKPLTVGLILPDLKSRYMLSLIESITDLFRQNNVSLLIATSNYCIKQEQNIIKMWLRQNVDGLILFPADGEDYNADLVKLSNKNFPLVFLDRNIPNINASFVHSNDVAASCQAVSFFIERGKKKIGLISPTPTNTFTLENRIKGYMLAMEHHNIPIDSSLMLTNLTNYDQNWENKFVEYFKQHPDLDAIFATNFDIGTKIYRISKQLNINISTDIMVIYYDDLLDYVMDLIPVKHNAIKQNTYKIGLTAAQIILDLVKNVSSNQEINIECDLIIRN